MDCVEVNSTFKPIPGLSITRSVNYVAAKLASDLPADVISAGTFGFSGDRVPLTPNGPCRCKANTSTN